MSTNYDLSGGNIIALYIWDRLKTVLGWKTDDYGGLIPIAHVQQQPELLALNKPFLVFGSATNPLSPLWLMESETTAFTVYSDKPNDITKVTNLVVSDLKRYDESAKSVNDFIQSLPADHPAKYFDFKTIRINGASGAQPTDQEGGWYDGDIIVRSEFTYYGPYGSVFR